MGQKITYSSGKHVEEKHNSSPKDDFVLTDVSKEELKERRIPVYPYLL